MNVVKKKKERKGEGNKRYVHYFVLWKCKSVVSSVVSKIYSFVILFSLLWIYIREKDRRENIGNILTSLYEVFTALWFVKKRSLKKYRKISLFIINSCTFEAFNGGKFARDAISDLYFVLRSKACVYTIRQNCDNTLLPFTRKPAPPLPLQKSQGKDYFSNKFILKQRYYVSKVAIYLMTWLLLVYFSSFLRREHVWNSF